MFFLTGRRQLWFAFRTHPDEVAGFEKAGAGGGNDGSTLRASPDDLVCDIGFGEHGVAAGWGGRSRSWQAFQARSSATSWAWRSRSARQSRHLRR
jgi:hypothetical protein